MRGMRKKQRIFCLSALLGCILAACSGPGKQKPQDSQVKMDAVQEDTDGGKTDGAEENGKEELESLKPILDADATDEELLELVKDDINVVSQDDYAEVIRDIKEHVEKYSGQIYQLEGFFTKKDGAPYITDAQEGEAGERLPLRYLTQEPDEGARLKITGVIGEGGSENEQDTGAALEVILMELLEK